MQRVSTKSVLAACVLLLAFAGPLLAQDATAEAEETVEWILENMAQVYAGCSTYSDSGVVKTIFFLENGERSSMKPFSTAFVRPDRFRFEYREQPEERRESHYIVWANGPRVQVWWNIGPAELVDRLDSSLALALGGGTGISGGSAHTIPALLLPDVIGGWRLMDMTAARRVEDQSLDENGREVEAESGQGDDCYRIQGCAYNDSPLTLWIEKETLLVRRIDQRNQFDDFRTETTTTYSPVLNGDISEEMLEFAVPEQE